MDVDEGSYHSKQLSVAAQSTSSVVSVHATALEVCESVYGEHPISHDALERFYESSASMFYFSSEIVISNQNLCSVSVVKQADLWPCLCFILDMKTR
jgi:hypothetical protein